MRSLKSAPSLGMVLMILGTDFLNDENQKINRSRNVIFNEKTIYKDKVNEHKGKKEFVDIEDISRVKY